MFNVVGCDKIQFIIIMLLISLYLPSRNKNRKEMFDDDQNHAEN